MEGVKLGYRAEGEVLVPEVSAGNEGARLGKYGLMRKGYLEASDPARYSAMALSGELYPHCQSVEKEARGRVEALMEGMLALNPPPDKALDAMGWAAHMNNLKARAEEAVAAELIYA